MGPHWAAQGPPGLHLVGQEDSKSICVKAFSPSWMFGSFGACRAVQGPPWMFRGAQEGLKRVQNRASLCSVISDLARMCFPRGADLLIHWLNWARLLPSRFMFGRRWRTLWRHQQQVVLFSAANGATHGATNRRPFDLRPSIAKPIAQSIQMLFHVRPLVAQSMAKSMAYFCRRWRNQ